MAHSRASAPGFALLEVLVAVAVIAFVIGAVMPSGQRRLDTARLERTLRDLEVLREGLQRVEEASGAWPATRDELHGRVISEGVALQTPWGTPYLLMQDGSDVSLAADIPVGLESGTSLGAWIAVLNLGGGMSRLIGAVRPSAAQAEVSLERRRVQGD
ncbi:MAG: type II secretion system protein [Candidatus Eiseniibacteriota bacterium]